VATRHRPVSEPAPAKPATPRLSPVQVIHTAAAIADREGIDAVTLTRVARELNVRQPALYRHVDGIEGLWKALALRARELLVARLTDAAIGRSREEAIRAVAKAWRQFVKDHPGLYTVTDRVPSAGDVDLEASVDRVVGVLALVLGSYSLGPATAVHAARSFRSALHGFVVLEKDHGHPEPFGLDESFEHLVTLLVAGVQVMSEQAAGQRPAAEQPPADPKSNKTSRPTKTPIRPAGAA